MRLSKSLYTAVSAFVLIMLPASSCGGFTVTGEETSPGNYAFVLQGMAGDPVQTRTTGSFNILDFKIDLPGIVIFSASGDISDGTIAMTPTLFGWTAPAAANTFDPTGVHAQLVTLEGDAGAVIETIGWEFASEEALNGTVVLVPEPASVILLGLGTLGLGRRQRCRV